MRRLLSSAAALFLVPAVLQADWIIKQKVDGNLQQGEMTIKIKEDRTRVDVGEQMSMLVNSGTGDTVTLMHQQKTFVRVPGSESKALLEQMQKLQKTAEPGEAPKLQATGQ